MLSPVFSLILSWVVTDTALGQIARVFTMDLDGQGPFGPGDDMTTSGAWREHFYRWMISNGWVGR